MPETLDPLNTTTDIAIHKIRQKKVQAFIHSYGLYRLADFARLKSFLFTKENTASFYHHRKSFIFKAPQKKVWDAYKNIAPIDAWKGNIVSFGFQYSRPNNTLSYLHDPYTGLEVGQLVFINVRFLMGLVNIAVGHEITEVDDAATAMRTCYLNGGKAEGTQEIKLEATSEGYTKVTHHTIYKSNSPFRDKYLYPILHSQAITSFHNNIRASLGI